MAGEEPSTRTDSNKLLSLETSQNSKNFDYGWKNLRWPFRHTDNTRYLSLVWSGRFHYAATCSLLTLLMPKIRTTRTKTPPEGFEEIEAVIYLTSFIVKSLINFRFSKNMLKKCEMLRMSRMKERGGQSHCGLSCASPIQGHDTFTSYITRERLLARSYTNGSWRKAMVTPSEWYSITSDMLHLLMPLISFSLIAKWKKAGYEKLCCVRCIQTMACHGATLFVSLP